MGWIELVIMIVGFGLASYSIVGNDAIQTLGTFLASNGRRPWWVLWAFAGGILVIVMLFGWFTSPQQTVSLTTRVELEAGTVPGDIQGAPWTDVDWMAQEPWNDIGADGLLAAYAAPVKVKLVDKDADLDFLDEASLVLVGADGNEVVLASGSHEPGEDHVTLTPSEAVDVLPLVKGGKSDLVLRVKGAAPAADTALEVRPALEAKTTFMGRRADVSYGRLTKYPLPRPFTWIYLVAPIVLLLLTRFGLPVSTTFLILTIFQAKNLPSMLTKSLAGYAIALLVGIVVYLIITKLVEKYFMDTADKGSPLGWVILQWCSTAFLWAMWLIQDLANIFVYLPRALSFGALMLALMLMLAVQAYIFYTSGGAIQKIVTSKTNTQDIRAATIIDFLFAILLLVFKEWSNMPMSTTWVFLGLLAGRELALNVHLNLRSWSDLGRMVGSDALKATVGLAVSVIIALGLPWLASMVTGDTAQASAQAEPAMPVITVRADAAAEREL